MHISQSSHLLTICSSELPFLVLGLLFFEGDYILLYYGTPTFWLRGLWDSCFQNPSESSVSYILWNRNSKFGMWMHLGMPECHKPFLGHYDLDLWPSFQELLCPEHISYIIWCRNPKFGVVIPLGMAEWCIPFWVTLTLTLTSGLISRFFVLYYS